MSVDASEAKCMDCGYTDDCDEVTENSGYNCEYCGGSNWNTADCD